MKFEIKARFGSATLFTAEIDAKFESSSESKKLGEAVRVAYLSGADLSGADLRGADLSGADLSGADLRGADLSGAYLRPNKKAKIIGERAFFQLGPLGSRDDYLMCFRTDDGVYVRAGCFFDTLAVFKKAVKETHAKGVHGKEYAAAITMIEAHYKLWPGDA